MSQFLCNLVEEVTYVITFGQPRYAYPTISYRLFFAFGSQTSLLLHTSSYIALLEASELF